MAVNCAYHKLMRLLVLLLIPALAMAGLNAGRANRNRALSSKGSSTTTIESFFQSNGSHCAPDEPRSDCGYFGIGQEECESRGCCWAPVAAEAAAGEKAAPAGSHPQAAHVSDGFPNDVPWCFHPNGPQQQPVYGVEAVDSSAAGAITRMDLRVRPTADTNDQGRSVKQQQEQAGVGVTQQQQHHDPLPSATDDAGDVPLLRLELQRQTTERIYMRLVPLREQKRWHGEGQGQGQRLHAASVAAEVEGLWRVPEELLPRPPPPTTPPPQPLYNLSLPSTGEDLRLSIARSATIAEAATAAAAVAAAAAAEVSSDAADDGGRAPATACSWTRAVASRLQAMVPTWLGGSRHRISPRSAGLDSPRAAVGAGHSHAGQQDKRLAIRAISHGKAAEEKGSTPVQAITVIADPGAKRAGLEAVLAAAGQEAAAGEPPAPLLDLSGPGSLVVRQQYLQLRLGVRHDVDLYGMGETTQPQGLKLRRDGARRALWNSDTPAAATGVNLYGSHPVLYGIGPDGSAFGLFVANSNAMDFAAGAEDVTFWLTGGILELYVFLGPTPQHVAEQYQEVVGRPAMPPRWALGFHQSRYGYRSLDELIDVVQQYDAHGIPLEVVWSDLDYTDRARMFTFDQKQYPLDRLRAFVDGLHASGRRWVPIVDCGMTALPGQGYEPYDRGLAAGVFIQDSSGQPLVGQVWSGATHWPDFLHPNASSYWTGLLQEMHDKVPYDGIWLDMNEPSNFCTGECKMPPAAAQEGESVPVLSAEAAGNASTRMSEAAGGHPRLGISCALECTQPSPDDPLANPPYRVNNGNRRAPLYSNTLPMASYGYNGVRQYDTHNLYALAESAVTHEALRAIKPGHRPFILTRSSWAGQGRYAAHWTGDNAASWDNLAWSGGGVLGAGMAGVALAGADVCGFFGDTNEQLCARWLSAAALQPFFRDHSDQGSQRQEAYRWPQAAEAARRSLAVRYALLPYLYTCFFVAHTRGGAVARPLAWHAPADPRSRDVAAQWLLGDDVLVAPVLSPDTDTVTVYFPGTGTGTSTVGGGVTGTGSGGRSASTWCRLDDLADCHTGPVQHPVRSLLGSPPPVFLRLGAVVPLQQPGPTTATTAASPLTLLVLLASTPSPPWPRTGPAVQGQQYGNSYPYGRDGNQLPDDVGAYGMLYADNGTTQDVGGAGTLVLEMRAGASLVAGNGWVEVAAWKQQQEQPKRQGDGRVGMKGHIGRGGRGGSWGGQPAVGTMRAVVPPQGSGIWDGGSWQGDTLRARHTLSHGRVGQGFRNDAEAGLAQAMAQEDEQGRGGGGRGGSDANGGGDTADVDVGQLVVGEVVVVGAALRPGGGGVAVEVGGVRVPGQQVQVDAPAHRVRVTGLRLAAGQGFRMTWSSA